MNVPPLQYPYVEISLDNILHNLDGLRRAIGPRKGIMAVVKDLAYGCGSVAVSRALETHGVEWLAVATAAEANAVRSGGVALPILVLGKCDIDELAWGSANNVSFSLNDPLDLSLWGESAVPVRFHVNIDTGMGRLGVLPGEIAGIAAVLKSNRALRCEGACTHLACADAPGTASVGSQVRLFGAALDILRQNGITPHHIHYANSAAIMRFPAALECTLVRPGISLYGCKPDPAQEFPLDLKCAAALKAHVVKIKRVPAGTTVSYGARYITPQETCIATIPLGYGIGLPRKLTGTGSVLIGGTRYAIAGAVTMDYIMADVGPEPLVRLGDEAVAIGYQGGAAITADEVGLLCGTIGYEILCGLSAKLDRYYYLKGSLVHHQQGFYF